MSVVRQARLEDAQAIAKIEIDTWRATYPGMLPDRILLNMSERRQTSSWASFLRHRPEDVWVAQHPHIGVIGFGNCGAQRDGTVDYTGEIYTLYVLPDLQGAGIGRALMGALLQRLEASGHRSALVWVVRGNPARFFYERLGGKQVMHRPIPLAGQPVEAIAYGWRNFSAVLGRHARSRGEPTGEPPVQ